MEVNTVVCVMSWTVSCYCQNNKLSGLTFDLKLQAFVADKVLLDELSYVS